MTSVDESRHGVAQGSSAPLLTMEGIRKTFGPVVALDGVDFTVGRSEVHEIARRLLGAVGRTLQVQRNIQLEFGSEVVEFLLDQGGYDPALGARPMKRTIARLVEAPLAERILRGDLPPRSVLLMCVENGELDFDVLDPAQGSGAAAE